MWNCESRSLCQRDSLLSKDLLAEAIACNTDASLAEARHIINSVLKVSDDEIFREVLKEQTK